MGAQGQAATEVLRTYAHTEVRLSTVGQSPRDPENTRPTLANQNAAWHPFGADFTLLCHRSPCDSDSRRRTRHASRARGGNLASAGQRAQAQLLQPSGSQRRRVGASVHGWRDPGNLPAKKIVHRGRRPALPYRLLPPAVRPALCGRRRTARPPRGTGILNLKFSGLRV